ncbi:adenosine 3'-phospho 5'-phosphosulfate transporter 2-like isoform X3 [Convolutriloba macropyga]|uniref:adenosine 3'-phospho 5'-phosphosulfate transporter 2-like isoform X3 n=1 Tax=Convolutriloba macropyga TaxID=536237 RepID=UPI003F5275DC
MGSIMDRGFPIDYTGDQTQTEEILKYNSFPGEVKAIESNQSYDSKSSDPVEDRLKIGLSIEKREESVNNNNNMVTSSSFSINMGAASSESFYTSYRAYKSWKPKPGTTLHFMGMTVLVFITYICYAVLQEALFTRKELKPYGWFLTWIQFAFYVLFAMWLLCAGLIWFSLADSTVQPNFHFTGIVIISSALVADAIIGNAQELFMKKYSAANTEVVFFSYLIGVGYIFVVVVFEGKLTEAVQLMDTHTLFQAFLFSMCGYFGVNLVLDLVVTYGALIAVTVTTCRKAVTIVISFLAFSKPFTVQYVFAGFVIFLGIFLNVYSKNTEQMNLLLRKITTFVLNLCGKYSFRSTSPAGIYSPSHKHRLVDSV